MKSSKSGILKVPALLIVLLIGMATTFTSDSGKYFEISKNMEIFSNLYKEINMNYVDELDPGILMRTGLDAMLASLDPFTNYISETQIEGYRYLTEGRYNGIGAQILVIGDHLTITKPHENSPAAKAGLKAGDKILKVDGQDAVGKKPEELDAILRGVPGTEIKFTIDRPGTENPIDISLSRDEVRIPNVPYSGMVSDDIGYINLTTFTREAGRNVAEAMRKLKNENEELKGIIFDLRGNGGGLLHEAVNVSNVWINKDELVVSTKGKVKDWDRSFKTQNSPIDNEIPLVVLINSSSASASEIVSGVVQDLDRGVLIGQRSYGKGLVQNTWDVGYNSKVKMTTAKYYIPSGRCIQSVKYEDGEPVHIPDDKRTPFTTRNGRTVLDGGGVKPDILVELDSDNALINALQEQFILFDYATVFVLEHDSIGEVADFHFKAWDDFVAYTKKRNFEYETESEKELAELKAKIAAEGIAANETVKALEAQLQAAKDGALEKNKAAIVDLIEKEIASRYHFQKGQVQIGLRNDKEVKEAIKLLNNPEEYQKILDK